MMRIIVFSDAWGYKYGGINSFNYEFCCALKRFIKNRNKSEEYLEGDIELIIVSDMSDKEKISFADDKYIHCVSLKKEEINASNAINLLTDKICENIDSENNFFVGHDIITGDIAIDCAKHFGGKSVIIRHMAYEEYYSVMSESEEKNLQKIAHQKQLLLNANIVLGVGEKLKESSKQIVVNNNGHAFVREILPGFDKQEQCSEYLGEQFRVYFAGRIEYENEEKNNNKIKQYDCVVKSFASLIENGNIPATSKLYLCGIASQSAKNHIKDIAAEKCKGIVNMELISYAKHDELMNILKNSSVAVMPSYSEGFGLVAVEAITSHVPVIISKDSGIYKLIEKTELTNCIEALEITGNDDKDVPLLMECLNKIYRDQKKYKNWTKELQQKLSNLYNWDLIAGSFLKLLAVSRFYKINKKDFERGLIDIFFPKK